MARGLFSVSNLQKQQEAKQDSIASLFLQRLEESIVKMQPQRKPSNYYKPSSMLCLRQMYFTRQGIEQEEEKQDPSFIGICDSGTDRHDRIQQALVKMKDFDIEFEYIDVETFVKEHNLTDIEIKGKNGLETKCFNKKYNISFFTDGIILHKPTGIYYIFEFKTEVSQKFSKRDKQQLEHETQGVAYSLSFNINSVLFVYEDRNFCNKKAFEYKVTPEDRVNKVVNKINACEQFLADNVVPPKITNKDIDENYVGGQDRKSGPSAKVCMYCGFKKECQKYL